MKDVPWRLDVEALTDEGTDAARLTKAFLDWQIERLGGAQVVVDKVTVLLIRYGDVALIPQEEWDALIRPPTTH